MTPDGYRYIAMAEGTRIARPFHYRFAIPAICGPWARYWRICSLLSAALLAVAGGWYGGFGMARACSLPPSRSAARASPGSTCTTRSSSTSPPWPSPSSPPPPGKTTCMSRPSGSC